MVLNVEEGSCGLRPLRLVNLGNARWFSYENYHTNSGQKKRNREIYKKREKKKKRKKKEETTDGCTKVPNQKRKKKKKDLTEKYTKYPMMILF